MLQQLMKKSLLGSLIYLFLSYSYINFRILYFTFMLYKIKNKIPPRDKLYLKVFLSFNFFIILKLF